MGGVYPRAITLNEGEEEEEECCRTQDAFTFIYVTDNSIHIIIYMILP
jgi:hypothetical protein